MTRNEFITRFLGGPSFDRPDKVIDAAYAKYQRAHESQPAPTVVSSQTIAEFATLDSYLDANLADSSTADMPEMAQE